MRNYQMIPYIITDFGITKHYVVNNSGTVGYLAPEVLCKVNHNFSIDYYSVGIKTYELMFSHRPYIGKNKHEVKQLILLKPKENMRIFLLVFLITFLTL